MVNLSPAIKNMANNSNIKQRILMHTKIKVMPTLGNSNEWNTIIAHARKLGAISRDGEYDFNADKNALLIDNNYIKLSSPTMKTKSGFVAPVKVSVAEFLALTSLHDVEFIGKPMDKQAVAKAVAATRASMPCAQTTLAVSGCDVLVQNPVLWTSQGLPRLKALGVEITMLGDVAYVIDVTSNSATEFNSTTASAQAKQDILDGKVTPYSIWANEFQLIENLVQTKVIPDQE